MLLIVVLRVVEEGRIWMILFDDCLGIIVDTGTCVASVGCTSTILLAENLLYCPRMTGTTT